MFSLAHIITEQIQEAGIPIHGVSCGQDGVRIDFKDEATKEQRQTAEALAATAQESQESLKLAYDEVETKKFTPEKAEKLAELLVSKGILTTVEVNSL